MIATSAQSDAWGATKRLCAVLAVASLSLLLVAAMPRLGWLAVGLPVFAAITALTAWRPRYGVYAVLLIVVATEPDRRDPFMYAGWFWQSNISMWTPIEFAIFTPVELVLIITAVVVAIGAVVERRGLAFAQLSWPLLALLALIVASLGWGVGRGGDANIALWEVRSLIVMVLVALLVPNVQLRREHVQHLVNLLTAAALLLSIDIIWRRFTLLEDLPKSQLDLAFSHETPVFMNFVVLLLLARLVWPATARQRLAALAIPIILYAEMLTQRRAGWIGLDVGLILLAIFIFRLRRRVFWFLVLPGIIVYLGYLGAFWNADGPLAQPARAVRSINSPDDRDMYSNLYRIYETANVRFNIHSQPLTGLGFGRQYVFYVGMPDLSWWPFWHYVPHNTVLWVWMKMGPLGFVTFLTVIGAAVVRGVQLLKQAGNDTTAPLLVAFVGLFIMTMVFSYVDLGLMNTRTMIPLGFALGVIGTWGRQAARQEEAR